MKIAQIVSTFPPYQGGMGNVAYNFANELEKLNHQVTVFTPRRRLSENCHCEDPPVGGDEAISKYILNTRLPRSLRSLAMTKKRIFGLYGHGVPPDDGSTSVKKGDLKETDFKTRFLTPFLKFGNAAFAPQLIFRLSGFDIVHLHWPFFGGSEAVYLFKKIKKSRVKFVVQYHMDVVAFGAKGIFFKIYNKILRAKILKAADLVICSSYDYINHSEVKEIYQEDKDKWLEISFGVDQEKFKPLPKKVGLLKKYKILPPEKIILFVGSLDKAHYFKGIEVLLEAFASLSKNFSEARLLIVGRGNLKENYQRKTFDLKIAEKVIFTGGVAKQDLPDYYNLAEVVVLPSIDRSEAFGLVLLEAMACAKPIIASDLAGVRTLVEVGINGYLARTADASDLAEKIKKILAEKELANFFGQAGRKKVEENYNWEKVGKKLEEAYLKIKMSP